MDRLLLLLSILSIPYGVSYVGKVPLPFVIITRFLFFCSVADQIRMTYDHFAESMMMMGAFAVSISGNLAFGLTLIVKGKEMVKSVTNNVHLMSGKQKRIFCLIFSLLILEIIVVMICRIFTSILPHIHSLRSGKGHTLHCIRGVIRNIIYPYYFWPAHSALIYALMYSLMHLKQMNLLSSVENITIHSYVTWFNIINFIKCDYETFDKLFSSFPAVCLCSIFTDTIIIIQKLSIVNFYSFINFLNSYICWPLVLFAINQLHSHLSKKVDQIILKVAQSEYVNELLKGHLVNLIKQISDFHITAFSVVRLDKSLVLPLLGSLFTFSLLFKEYFL